MRNDTQQKINIALAAIQYISNTLNVVNIEMRQTPSTGPDAIQFQIERLNVLDGFAKRLIDLANDMGDYSNNWDMMGEEELSFMNGMFNFINEEEGEG